MKRHLLICSMLLLVAVVTSCNGQIKTEEPQSIVSPPRTAPADSDPYFIETNTITAPYGPGSITRNIMQDRKGNIWLATWEGIIRYDGKTFTNFTNKDGLRRYHVFAVLEDRAGNLWFGTIGAGVYRYDGKSFTNFTTKEGLVSDRIGCFLEDKAGNIWIGTEGGASRFDGERFTNFTTKEGLINPDINAIIEDEKGNLWFGARGEACIYDGVKFTELTTLGGQPFINVRSMIEDKNGNIWLGGNDGLWRFNAGLFTNFSKDFVGYIHEDSQGNIWTSSEKHNTHTWVLSRYNAQSLRDKKAPPATVLQREGMFFGILEDRDGGIWLGTLEGVCRYDGLSFNCFKE